MRSLSAEMKHQFSPFGHSYKTFLNFSFMALAEDSANLPECWSYTLSRLQRFQGSLSTAWHSTTFSGSLRSWPKNSDKTRVQLRQLRLYMWTKAGTTVTRNIRTCTVLLRPSRKDLLNASQVPRYLVGSIDMAKQIEFSASIMITCWTYINSCSFPNRYLKSGINSIAVRWAAVQNT